MSRQVAKVETVEGLLREKLRVEKDRIRTASTFQATHYRVWAGGKVRADGSVVGGRLVKEGDL